MFDRPAIAQRHAATLARLAELGMAMAEQAAQDAQAAETPAARADAAKTFHILSGIVGRSVALEARIVRDAGRDEAEAQAEAEKAAEAAQGERRAQARKALSRMVWGEWRTEPEEGFDMIRKVGGAIETTRFTDDEPLEDQILRLMDDLGYVDADDDVDGSGLDDGGGDGEDGDADGDEAVPEGALAAIYPGGPRPVLGPDGAMTFNGRLAPPMELLFPPNDGDDSS